MALQPKVNGTIKKSELFNKKNETVYCLGTVESDKYVYANEKQANLLFVVLSYMDGTRTLDEIKKEVQETYNVEVDINKIYNLFLHSGILIKPKEVRINKKSDELEFLLSDVKEISLKKLYKIFDIISKHFKFVILTMLLMCLTLFYTSIVFNNKSIVWNIILSNFRIIIYLVILSFSSIFLHEMAHAIVAYHYGLKPKSVTFSIYAYSGFLFYVKLPGIYFLKPNTRIKIWSAGVLMNLFLSSLFFTIFVFTSGEISLIASLGFILNLISVFTNLIPLFYSDGYYILMTLLKKPNLRKKSFWGAISLIKEKPSRETIIYWLYMIVTVSLTATLLIVQGYSLINNIIYKINIGYSTQRLIADYFNIVLCLILGALIKIFSVIRKRKLT